MGIILSSTKTLLYQCVYQAQLLCWLKNRLNVLADYNLIHPKATLFIFGVYRTQMKGKSAENTLALVLHLSEIQTNIHDVIA